MLKLLGAAATVVGCTALGFLPGRELRRSAETLDQLAQGLALLEYELRLRGESLPVLMERLADSSRGAARQLFRNCGAGLTQLDERPFARIWEEAVAGLDGLCPDGRAQLCVLGQYLGRYEAGVQCRAAEEVRQQLEQLRREKREDSRRLGKVYQAVGVTGGVFLMILLL